MAYIEKNLTTGETILFRTGLHWIVLFVPILFGVFMFFFGLFALIAGLTTPASGEIGFALLITSFGVLAIVMAVVFRNATEMAVTNKRVIAKAGFFRTRSIELFLSKVESIGVERGLLGKMLGYGRVVVRGTGGTAEPFNRVRSPLEFRRRVQQQSETPQ